MFKYRGDYGKAKEYFGKAFAIRRQIGDKAGEAADYARLGPLYQLLVNVPWLKFILKRHRLSISRDIKDLDAEFRTLCNLTFVKTFQYKIQEALDCLFWSMNKSEIFTKFVKEERRF